MHTQTPGVKKDPSPKAYNMHINKDHSSRKRGKDICDTILRTSLMCGLASKTLTTPEPDFKDEHGLLLLAVTFDVYRRHSSKRQRER
jgi:hypothetical protein